MKLWHIQADGMDGQIAKSVKDFEEWLESEDYLFIMHHVTDSVVSIEVINGGGYSVAVFTLTLVEVLGE